MTYLIAYLVANAAIWLFMLGRMRCEIEWGWDDVE